jgi:hypothetical protein
MGLLLSGLDVLLFSGDSMAVPMLFAAARSSSILLLAVNDSYAFLRVLM